MSIEIIYGDTESLPLNQSFSDNLVIRENYLNYLILVQTNGKINPFLKDKEKKIKSDNDGYKWYHVWIKINNYIVDNNQVYPIVNKKNDIIVDVIKDINGQIRESKLNNYVSYKDKLGNIYFVNNVSENYSDNKYLTYAGYHQLKFVS